MNKISTWFSQLRSMQYKFIKVIAISEIVGGIAGICLVIWLFFINNNILSEIKNHLLFSNFDSDNALMVLILLFMVTFGLFIFTMTTIAGYFLLKKNKWGVRMSKFVQFLQIPCFYIAKYYYFLGTGAWAFLVLKIEFFSEESYQLGSNIDFSVFGATMNIGIGDLFVGVKLGINIVALIFFTYLFHSKQINNMLQERENQNNGGQVFFPSN